MGINVEDKQATIARGRKPMTLGNAPQMVKPDEIDEAIASVMAARYGEDMPLAHVVALVSSVTFKSVIRTDDSVIAAIEAKHARLAEERRQAELAAQTAKEESVSRVKARARKDLAKLAATGVLTGDILAAALAALDAQ